MNNPQLPRYVFFQILHNAGFCDIENRNQYAYEHNLNPIVFSILEATDEYVLDLMRVMKENPKAWAERIVSEIRADVYKIFTS